MTRLRFVVSLLALAAGAAPAARAAPAGPAGPLGAPSAAEPPIERVVVYSDQARVFRGAQVVLGAAATRVSIAALPPAARPDTVQVDCATAEITHVEVSRSWERLPRQAEARALLHRIEGLRDELRALDDEQRLLRIELGFVDGLQPAVDRPKPDKTPPLLFVEAWRRVLQWAEGRAVKVRARLAAFPAQRHALAERLEALRVEGRKLLPDARTGAALRVAVTLRGAPGPHRVVLSYVVGGVRWLPSYDLRYEPQGPGVEATYYALVSQSSGEDWRDAHLAFSTIMPSNLLAVPELPTWTLGRTTSFTPTPRQRGESRPVPWQAPEPAPPADTTMVELEEAVGRAPAAEESRERATGVDTTSMYRSLARLRALVAGARNQRDVVKLNCLNDKLVQAGTLGRMAVAADQEARVADPTARSHAQVKQRIIARRVLALQQEAERCVGAESVATGRLQEQEKNLEQTKEEAYHARARVQLLKRTARDTAAATPASPAPPPAEPGSVDADEARPTRMRVLAAAPAARRSRRGFSFGAGSAPPPRETVPWTDTGYQPPQLDPDLPAASAKGHRFTMDAPGRHTVIANGSAVRVPLLRQRFAVNPVYKIVPGRSKAAYLTAEIYNSSGRPVLRGHANLFTGATYTGQTKLETAVPGGKLLLPLGVDEGVKVNRTIDQRTVATGIIFKDDVSEYTVTIEVANHRRHAIQVAVDDQVPVKQNADVKVEGFEASPAMTGPALDGKVTWKGTVGAGSVQKLVFKFRIVRSKNWELRQHDG